MSEQIQSGLTYQFRLRAKNKWGWGAYSEVTSVQAANKPLPITDLTSHIDESSGNIVLSWTLAADQSSPLTETTIELWSVSSGNWIA
jgi:hypothetical protein